MFLLVSRSTHHVPGLLCSAGRRGVRELASRLLPRAPGLRGTPCGAWSREFWSVTQTHVTPVSSGF